MIWKQKKYIYQRVVLVHHVSRVMAQLHLDEAISSSALRISFGEHTTREEIDRFCYYLQESMRKLKKQR